MAPIFWKIYGALNTMRENIVNRTRYWIYNSFSLREKKLSYGQYSIFDRNSLLAYIQVKTRFLDINSQATFRHYALKDASETKLNCSDLKLNIKPPLYSQKLIKSNQYKLSDLGTKNFNQWLAGLMDADGYIYYNSKINVITIEITMATIDCLALKAIKERYGGSINKRSGSQSYRWRISSRKNVIHILQSISGDLKNPVRIAQFNQVCQILNLTPRPIRDLSWDCAWLTGFFDGDGTPTLLVKRPKTGKNSIGCRGIQISFSQKNKFILELIHNLIGGSLNFDKSSQGWKLSISSRTHVLFLYTYFQRFPSLTNKNNRIQLIPKIYKLQDNKEASSQDWESLYDEFYNQTRRV